jgi:rhomboid protease GluP
VRAPIGLGCVVLHIADGSPKSCFCVVKSFACMRILAELKGICSYIRTGRWETASECFQEQRLNAIFLKYRMIPAPQHEPENTALNLNFSPAPAVPEVSTRPVVPMAATAFQPWVTLLLIAINVLVYIVMVFRGVSLFSPTAQSLIPWGANYGPLTTHGEWWRMITATFVHSGLMHLLLNMYCFFSVGLFMEALFGRARYISLYLLSGLGGSLLSLYVHPSIVCVGASGAIFGVYGGVIGFLIAHARSANAPDMTPLWKNALTFLGINLFYGMANSEVDVSGHIGGLVTGIVVGAALTWTLPRFSRVPAQRAGVVAAAIVAVAASALGAITTRVPVSDDIQGELKRVVSVESSAVNLYNDALGKVRRGEMKPEQFMRVTKDELLPPWKSERERILKLRVDGRQKELANKLVRYMDLRTEAWALMADGLVKNDVNMVREANAKQAEAMAILSNPTAKRRTP